LRLSKITAKVVYILRFSGPFLEDAMSKFKEAWPLAFALAMASGSSQADVPVDTNPSAFFQAGSLADALRKTNANQATDGRSGMYPIQLSQWFNFANCFSGVWRRC
jgi:hypothetical protein